MSFFSASFWLIPPITAMWIALELVELMLIDFGGLPPWKVKTILILATSVAVLGGGMELYQNFTQGQANQTIGNVSRKVDTLQDKLDKDDGLITTIAKNQALAAEPGLKKDALELGSTLMSRGSQVLALAAAHGDNSARRREQSQIDEAKLMDDYKNFYAKQIIALHDQFLGQGQDWKDEQYYSNPANAREVANVGIDLIRHANQLH